MPNAIITLAAARRLRESRAPVIRNRKGRAMTTANLAMLADIPLARMMILESTNRHVAEEPWLDEACRIAHVLGVDAMEPLVGGTTDLLELAGEDDPYDALEVWRTGVRLPLRFGIRLGRMFDMSPLALLAIPPSVWQLGRVVASGERTGGLCPWCGKNIWPAASVPAEAPDRALAVPLSEDTGLFVGGPGSHLPTCTLGNLYHPRDINPATLGVPPKPRRPNKRTIGSKKAPGLQRLRERLGITQDAFAQSIGKHPAYYSRLEKLRDPLNNQLAELICATYKISMLDLYS